MHRTAPVEVLTTATFASIDAGILHTCAVSLSGAVYCWGFNGTGQLGDGTTTLSTGPVEISGGHTFASVAAGGGHSCAVTTDGAAYCWGYDRSGQLGNGIERETQNTVPVRVGAALVFRSVSAGLTHTCGVTTDNVAYCWGLNSSGQLGIARRPTRMNPNASLVRNARSGWLEAVEWVQTCGVRQAGAEAKRGSSEPTALPYYRATVQTQTLGMSGAKGFQSVSRSKPR